MTAPLQTHASVAGFDTGVTGVTPPSKPDRRGEFLTDVIVELGFADEEAIQQAELGARESGKTIERTLLENHVLDEHQLSRAIAERNGLDHVELERFQVDMGAAEMVGRSAAQRYRAVPIAYASDGALLVAVEDPLDSLGISDIEVMTKSEVRPVIAAAGEIASLIERLPEADAVAKARTTAPPPAFEPAPQTEPPPVSEQSPVSEPPPAPVAQPEAQPQSEPPPLSVAEPQPPPEPEPEPESPAKLTQLPQPEPQSEPPLESQPPPGPEPDVEPVAAPKLEPEPGPTPFPAPEPEPFPAPEPEPEPREPAAQVAPALSAELRALQETADRTDALAATVERRIEQLESADERARQLEQELAAAHRRTAELEQRLSGADTAAEELRAATEKLEALNRTLENAAG
jgi:hypothetical protein